MPVTPPPPPPIQGGMIMKFIIGCKQFTRLSAGHGSL
jgi:hypothetical protein